MSEQIRETWSQRKEREKRERRELIEEIGLLSVLSEYTNKREEIERIKKEAKEKAQTIFKEAVKFLFEKLPDVQSFEWHQYTPYFNDGEPCIFEVYSDYEFIQINGEELGYVSDEKKDDTYKAKEKVAKTVAAFIEAFDDEDLLDMFGDHVRVTVTREGVEVNDYEHE